MKNSKTNVSKRTSDLPESADDKRHMKQEEVTLDLPEVKDIPGQEHIHVPKMNEFVDTTISSDDEEGVGLFGDEEDDEINSESTVSKDEKKLLRDAAEKTPNAEDENNLAAAQLDKVDEEGELLNERTNVSGSDLDIPGSEADDANEEIGEEDEENNAYSLDGEDEDDSTSKQ